MLLLLATSLTTRAAAQVKPAVAYTGKTYGYLRNDVGIAKCNDGSIPECKNGSIAERSDAGPEGSLAIAFADNYREIKGKYPQAILVGMGDNFAPDYRARYFRTKDCDAAVGRVKIDPLFSPAAQFFKGFDKGTGYDAMVPGQLDFYFGAEFLRRVGQEYLPMLAANLVIQSAKQPVTPQPLCGQPQLLLPTQVSLPLQSSSGSGGGGKGKGKKGGAGGSGGGASSGGGGSAQGSSGSSSGQGGGGQSGQLCLQERTAEGPAGKTLNLVSPSADSVYPWVTEFEFSLPEGSQQPHQASLCPWKPQRWNVADCSSFEAPIRSGQTYLAKVTTSDWLIQKDGSLLSSDSKPLHSGADISICVPPSDPKNPFVCTSKPIHVQRVFFERAWKTVELPFGARPVNYAVFAALDPAIQGLISPENSSWGTDNQYTAKIGILDPAPALTQLMTTFQTLHQEEQWTYVLLAQMQRAQAQALAASLRWQQEHPPKDLPAEKKPDYRFQVIISAADYDEATPEASLTLHADADYQHPPTPVITPHPIVTEQKQRNPLGVVEVEDSPDGTTTYANHIFGRPVPCDGYTTILATLNAASLEKLQKLTPTAAIDSTCNDKNSFQCLTLKQMRDQLEADAAILQRRDFYSDCNYDYEGPTSAPSNEMVRRVLWNSGYLTRASVSGTTLKAIVQASENIKKLEQSSTNEPLERGGDLVSIGITKSSGRYYVNGAVLEDSKIYSIATSDQLTLGDPNYPQFAQPDLVVPTVFTEFYKKTFAIADLAASPFLPYKYSHRQLRDSDISLTREQIVATLQVPSPINPPNPRGPFPPPFTPEKNPVVNAFQNRPVLSITLQQASVGYTNSKPSQTDANIATNLGGVTNPNVVSPHSDSLSYSDQFRLLYQRNAHWNFGFDQIITFARTRQGSVTAVSSSTKPPVTTTGAPVPLETINLSANTLIVSPFVEFQPHRYDREHWKVVGRPITFTSGLSRTLQFLATGSTGVQYELNLKRQENWQPSIGGRYEWNNLNFFETGYLLQSARNVVSALFVNGKAVPLTAGTTISSVVSKTQPLMGDLIGAPVYATFRQQGAYWLGMYTKTLTGNAKTIKLTYQGYTFGNFFAYGAAATTSTALTRYAAELSNNLQVQLWGNFSIGPAYNIFWFQDQSHSIGNSLTRRDWNIQANYTFDWHQGLEWKDVLEGKTQ
jgi:hypothetical protein